MRTAPSVRSLLTAITLCALGACGGGGDAPPTTPAPPAPPPAGTLVGAAGGTVTGPNGARIEIPAGALATETRINIEQTQVGAPPLSTGLTASGSMFAFTPHGTTFAVPVTVTLPFDATLVPAGSIPALFKTNAQTQWERVARPLFVANTVRAQITSFSMAQVVTEPLTPDQLLRHYNFLPRPGLGTPEAGDDDEGVLDQRRYVDPAGVFDLPLDGDDTSALEIFSAADGLPFWVASESGKGMVILQQDRSFIKQSDNATLEVVITAALVEAIDLNGVPGYNECEYGPSLSTCSLIHGSVNFEVELTRAELFGGGEDFVYLDDDENDDVPVLDTGGSLRLYGHMGLWSTSFQKAWGRMTTPFTAANIEQSDDIRGDPAKSHPRVRTRGPVVIPVDLSRIERYQRFWINTTMTATTTNRRGRESGIGAFLRDPTKIGGSAVHFTGLQPSFAPRPTPRLPRRPVSCAGGPDPQAGTLQLSADHYLLREGAAAADGGSDIQITRTNGSRGMVSATFSVGGGTAVSGVHYAPIGGTVFFADGETTPGTIDFDLPQNETVAPDTTFNLTLSLPGGCAVLGPQTNAVVTVVDDDRPPPQTLFTVGGTVSGLGMTTGGKLILEDHHGLFLEIAANGPFTFTSLPSPAGTSYSVRVFGQPRNALGFQTQVCTVANGSGIFGSANVTNVAVTCVEL